MGIFRFFYRDCKISGFLALLFILAFSFEAVPTEEEIIEIHSMGENREQRGYCKEENQENSS